MIVEKVICQVDEIEFLSNKSDIPSILIINFADILLEENVNRIFNSNIINNIFQISTIGIFSEKVHDLIDVVLLVNEERDIITTWHDEGNIKEQLDEIYLMARSIYNNNLRYIYICDSEFLFNREIFICD